MKKLISILCIGAILFAFSGCAGKRVSELEQVPRETFLHESGNLRLKEGEIFEIDFKGSTTINTMVLSEKGANCEKFNLYSEDENGERTLIYDNDIIDKYLYCSFDDTEVSKLVFEVEKAAKTVKLQTISFYNVEKKAKDFRVHAYYSLWGMDSEEFSLQLAGEADNMWSENFDVVTDVIVISNIYWNKDGTLLYSKENTDKEFAALRELIGDRDINIWVCFLNPRAEDGSIDNKSSVYSIKNHVDELTDNIVEFCDEYDLYGVDFDWEYPRLPHVWSTYNTLLTTLKPKLVEKDLKFSSALGPWGNMLSKEAKEALDFVNVMSYDWSKNKRDYHAEFFTCHYFSARYMLDQGFKKEQLVLGVPFYGNSLGKGEFSQVAFASVEGSEKGRNVYTVNDRDYYFNGYNSIYSKTAYTYDMDFAGIMMWNGQLDLPPEKENNLFDAMEEAIENRSIDK